VLFWQGNKEEGITRAVKAATRTIRAGIQHLSGPADYPKWAGFPHDSGPIKIASLPPMVKICTLSLKNRFFS
jgi:hypothetical protein